MAAIFAWEQYVSNDKLLRKEFTNCTDDRVFYRLIKLYCIGRSTFWSSSYNCYLGYSCGMEQKILDPPMNMSERVHHYGRETSHVVPGDDYLALQIGKGPNAVVFRECESVDLVKILGDLKLRVAIAREAMPLLNGNGAVKLLSAIRSPFSDVPAEQQGSLFTRLESLLKNVFDGRITQDPDQLIGERIEHPR